MTAEIVNLRLARKAKQRLARADEASANRARHGRSRSERETSEREATRAARLLDNHRRDALPRTGAEGDDPVA